MLVFPDGRTIGTIRGGCYENDAFWRARGAIASGKAAGTLTSDPVLARRYLELGCTFVATGVDVLVYANAARKLAAEFLPDTATAAATRPGAAY